MSEGFRRDIDDILNELDELPVDPGERTRHPDPAGRPVRLPRGLDMMPASFLERACDAFQDLVAIMDTRLRIMWMNEAQTRICRQAVISRVGGHCYEVLWEKTSPCRHCPALRVLDDHGSHIEEFHSRRMGKTYLVTASPLFDEKNNLAGFVHVTKDITERKLAEEALQRSEILLRGLFNSLEEAVLVLSPDKTIVKSNLAAVKIFGYTQQELEGNSIAVLHRNPRDYNYFEDLVKEAFHDEKAVTRQFAMERKGGLVFPAEHTVSLLRKDSGTHRGVVYVVRDDTLRQQAEEALKKAYDELETRVEERTMELLVANRRLTREITERKRTEEILRKSEAELDFKSKNLEDTNIALRVLLKTREDDRLTLEKNVLSNVKELVSPFMEKLEFTQLDQKQKAYLNILKSNFENIVSPFTQKLSSQFLSFTPGEIRVANLVKDGKTNKDIAELLNLSVRTVAFHRENIRKKLGLKNMKTNLRSYLLSM